MPKNRRQRRQIPNRRPAPPGSATGSSRRPNPTPPSRPGWRASLEQASYPVLLRLTSAPKWLLGAVTGAVLLGGLLAPTPWAPILMTLIVLFLTWLLVLAWPKLEPTARLIRGAVIGGLAAIVVAQSVGVF